VLKDTLKVVNEMRHAGVISKYAIGGAIGALFYLEPSLTRDVDIFVVLPTVPGAQILSLSKILRTSTPLRIPDKGRVHCDWRMAGSVPARNHRTGIGGAQRSRADRRRRRSRLGDDRGTSGRYLFEDWTGQGLCSHRAIY